MYMYMYMYQSICISFYIDRYIDTSKYVCIRVRAGLGLGGTVVLYICNNLSTWLSFYLSK